MSAALTPETGAGSLPDDSRSRRAGHYDFLDGIRALLALYVVVHHAWMEEFDFSRGVSHVFLVLQFGHFAVCFFIVLSGFCLTLPTLKRGLGLNRGVGDFIKRRAWRIIPPYYFALLLSLLLIYFWIGKRTGSHWDNSVPISKHDVEAHLLLIQNLPGLGVGLFKINHVFWSISLEWQIYFLFPVLLLAGRVVGPGYTTLSAVFLSAAMEGASRHYFHTVTYVHFVGFFAAGMLAAWLSFMPDPALNRYRLWPWRAIAVAGLLIFGISTRFSTNQFLLDEVFCCFCFSFLVFTSLHPESWTRQFLSLRPLVFIGSFSYSLYLIHAPLLQLLWQYPFSFLQFRPNLMCLALIFIGTPPILLVSWLFYWFCERPFVPTSSRSAAARPVLETDSPQMGAS